MTELVSLLYTCIHLFSVLEALSRDFRMGVLWELFFADDLVIIATSVPLGLKKVAGQLGLHVKKVTGPD